MAAIANTMFEARATNSVFDELANITGVFQNATPANEICAAGFLCVRNGQYGNQGYTGINNTNAWKMKAAVDTDYDGIYACNPFDVQMIASGNGNVYKIGDETLGLAAPAGYPTTFTKIDFNSNDKIYRFGAGNLSGAISTNTFFTLDDGLLVPAAAAPTAEGTPYFKLIGTGTATFGAYAGMTYYDVMACRDVVIGS